MPRRAPSTTSPPAALPVASATQARVVRRRGAVVRQSLVDACRRLLATHPPAKITTAMLLREAGVARATLYHHFPSAEALLQSTLVEVFTRRAAKNIAVMKEAVAHSKTREQFLDVLREITAISQAPAQRSDRLDRVRLIAHTEDNPALRRILAREQERLTQTLIWIVKTGQRRGWVRRDLPARPVAVLVQAYTLGRVVDDLAETQMRQQEWTDLIATLVIDGVTRTD